MRSPRFDAAVDELLPFYDRLIDACTVYMNKNAGVGSTPGQARLRLVREDRTNKAYVLPEYVPKV